MALLPSSQRELVLIGGGHAHVQLLRRWMMEPLRDTRVRVVLDTPDAVYSGMVPGNIAGDYRTEELEIDLAPLAARAGASVILAPAIRIDPVKQEIHFDERPPLRYDIASLDVGSSVRGLEIPGVVEHAVATRPIRSLINQIDARLDRLPEAGIRVNVVGAGAAGIELGFALRARLGNRVSELRVLGHEAEPLPGYPAAVIHRLRREAGRAGIALRSDAPVDRVAADSITVRGDRIPSDLTIWATGAIPPRLIESSDLPKDDRGYVTTDSHLRVMGFDTLFAAGDCAVIATAPWVPRAGVYAVRAGPTLEANLRASVHHEPLRRYRPQRQFLSLINLGEKRALASKWGLVASGAWVWKWKDWIDRRFMAKFQVPRVGEHASPWFPEMIMDEDMACGGCAAKLGPRPLARALSRLPEIPSDASVVAGLEPADDAAAVETPRGDVVLATIDAFSAFMDDPWLVGNVAAVNAVSDVLAKGGHARHALAFVNLPEGTESSSEELLFQVLSGVRAALDPLQISLVGGHTTTTGAGLLIGLSVMGGLPDRASMLGISEGRSGDALILTKPIGSGIVLAGQMRALSRGRWLQATLANMLENNAAAAEVARKMEATTCTDISGFGLVGHLLEVVEASQCGAELWLDALPLLPGVEALAGAGVLSTFHAQNATLRSQVDPQGHSGDDPRALALFDPQTSGGLLFSVPPSATAATLQALKDAGVGGAWVIGRMVAAAPGARRIRIQETSSA